MKKSILLDKVRMILFIAVLGAISAGLLVVVDFYTSQRVEKNEELDAKSSVMYALDISHDKSDIEAVFDQNVEVVDKSGIKFYQSKDGEIAFMFSGSGLWGPITGIVALDSTMESIKGVRIIDQEETPGLGSRITENDFLDTFREKKVIPQLVILPATDKATEKNEVDGIAGATMTSKALEDILNQEITRHKEVWGG